MSKTLRCNMAPACNHPMMEVCLTPQQLAAAEAVVEAARELERELADCYVPPGRAWDAWQRFHDAMEALEEAGDE